MCEALVRVVDQTNSDDASLDVGLSKAGNVICLVEDGWPWSALERTEPFWRIVKFPGVAVSAVQDLVYSERAARLVDNPSDPLADPRTNRMLQFRAFSIDFTKLPPAVQTALAKPRTGDGTLTATVAQIQAAKKRVATRTLS